MCLRLCPCVFLCLSVRMCVCVCVEGDLERVCRGLLVCWPGAPLGPWVNPAAFSLSPPPSASLAPSRWGHGPQGPRHFLPPVDRPRSPCQGAAGRLAARLAAPLELQAQASSRAGAVWGGEQCAEGQGVRVWAGTQGKAPGTGLPQARPLNGGEPAALGLGLSQLRAQRLSLCPWR